MKRSLTRQIMAIIICLVAGAILTCFIINTSFLGMFYTFQKKHLLMENFESFRKPAVKGFCIPASLMQILNGCAPIRICR